MANLAEVSVNGISKYGYIIDSNIAWIGFNVNDGNELRILFPATFQADIKLVLMLLQKSIADERSAVGLPAIESTYTVAVERLEYGRDDIQQIALIRTRFQNGASTDTPIEKAQIQQTIEFLQTALETFENQPANPAH
ncbi:MAG TPA: hypothetical protein VIE91_09240 [Methylophilaceae bacterium]|jgi:hypothetical protein